jgi:lipopolysaccharide/colanic/teichoic acid biosynthesis glycosyltransferase
LREAADIEAFTYRELSSGGRWLSRWPQLWSILKGDFAWVGNRPLGPAEAVELTSEFDRLWLAAPVGMISLAQVEGSFDAIETRAWASLYALQANWRLDLSILARAFFSPTRSPATALS